MFCALRRNGLVFQKLKGLGRMGGPQGQPAPPPHSCWPSMLSMLVDEQSGVQKCPGSYQEVSGGVLHCALSGPSTSSLHWLQGQVQRQTSTPPFYQGGNQASSQLGVNWEVRRSWRTLKPPLPGIVWLLLPPSRGCPGRLYSMMCEDAGFQDGTIFLRSLPQPAGKVVE